MKFALLALSFAVCMQSAEPVRPPSAAAGAPDRALLVTGTSVEALAEATNLSLQGRLTVNLEPGIRFNTVDGAYTFATHDGNKVEIETGSDLISLPSPVTALLTDRGWEFNGNKPVKTTSLVARRHQAQDDADSNLNSMKEAAQKLKAKAPLPARKLRVRWLYAENAFATAELFNTPAIQQLSHISPAGF